jgi:hypothetical protein
MNAIDDHIIALFDRATTAMQRRGWLPLNTLIMAAECLIWAALAIPTGRGLFDWYMILLAAVSLSLSFANWRNAHGYWEDHRKAQHLNALVVVLRYFWRIRSGIACALGASYAIQIYAIGWDPLSLIGGAGVFCLLYLKCCRYLGPGDFARERRESFSGAAQEG